MMAQLKLLQDCNHEVMEKTSSLSTVTLCRGYKLSGALNPGNIDPIEKVYDVSVIDKIEQNISGKLIVLSPEIYNLYDNRVVWTRRYAPGITGKYHVPNLGEYYNVHLKHMITKFSRYALEDCVRCNGTGWYVAPITTERGMEIASGPLLVAQEFIKCLLTTSGSDYLDDSYGASLLGNSGTINYLDKNTSNNIRDAIRNAEMQCIQNIDFQTRPMNEILDHVVINTIEPDYNNSGVYVNLTLYTVEGSRVSFNLGV